MIATSLGAGYVKIIDPNTVWILSDEEKPEWGTEWGNLFEIGLLPKVAFDNTGARI